MATTDGRRRADDDDAAHRPHRPDLREDRHADDEDAARARPPGAGAAAARRCRIRCPKTCGAPAADRPAHGAARRALSAGRHADSTTLNAFRSPAQRRLIFEEFFLFQLGLVLRKRRRRGGAQAAAVLITDDDPRVGAPRAAVQAHRRSEEGASREIVDDMQRPQPMNRLLQGDVGSGKTIVALMAALVAMENGLQVAFMAPTEILAEQHFINIRRLLEPSRFRHRAADRRDAGEEAARDRRRSSPGGSLHLVVGTHALVQDPVGFRELGLVDHRRAAPLRRAAARDAAREGAASRRAGDDGHADSAHARADDLRRSRRVGHARDAAGPPCRSRRSPSPRSRRDEIYDFIRGQLEDAGRHAIYPLVEESAKVDLKAAKQTQLLPCCSCGW